MHDIHGKGTPSPIPMTVERRDKFSLGSFTKNRELI